MAIKMSKVIDCEAVQCAYNKDKKCHTMAITIGDPLEPACDTYCTNNGTKGGFSEINGGVGACKVSDCEYNDSFECTASGIHVKRHADHADCITYKPHKL